MVLSFMGIDWLKSGNLSEGINMGIVIKKDYVIEKRWNGAYFETYEMDGYGVGIIIDQTLINTDFFDPAGSVITWQAW